MAVETAIELRPPKAFMDWLDTNYGWTQANSWRLSHRSGEQWLEDPVYLYWEQNTPEGQSIASLKEAIGANEFNDIFASAMKQGILTEDEATGLYYKHYKEAVLREQNFIDKVPAETRDYLNQYTSEKDLADRINRMGADQRTTAILYKSVLGRAREGELPIREAKGRVASAEEETRLAEEKAQEKTRLTRAQSIIDLGPSIKRILQNPFVSEEDKTNLTGTGLENLRQVYLQGREKEVFDYLGTIEQNAAGKEAGKAQGAEAILRSLKKPGYKAIGGEGDRGWRERALRSLPSAEPIAESFLQSTGLGEGTKLKSFIESKLPEIVQGTAGARKAWWLRMNEPKEEKLTLKGEQRRLGSEAAEWGRIAKTAPSEEYLGGTYYGAGGLQAIAQKAYESAQGKLAGLRPEDYPQGYFPTRKKKVVEDPLLKSLRRRNLTAEYYQMPRTGLVPRLTPSVRY